MVPSHMMRKATVILAVMTAELQKSVQINTINTAKCWLCSAGAERVAPLWCCCAVQALQAVLAELKEAAVLAQAMFKL